MSAVAVAATEELPLQFWFELASMYSYVAALRIERECAAALVPLSWKPFLLGPIFTEQLGLRDSPFNAQPVRGRYMWRDLERLCEKHGLPWRRPSVFPRNSVLAARVACAGATEPWLPAFVRAAFEASFAHDRDVADAEVLREILAGLKLDPAPILERAGSQEVRAMLRANTSEAMRLGIFGAPDFEVGGELFFGQDRLGDAIAWSGRGDGAVRRGPG